jgi:hypothetical protein
MIGILGLRHEHGSFDGDKAIPPRLDDLRRKYKAAKMRSALPRASIVPAVDIVRIEPVVRWLL